MTSAVTSPPAAAQACKLAGERRRDGTNGGHQHVEGDAANSPVTKTTAEDPRTATASRKSGGDDWLDDDGGVPAVDSDGRGADEDGDATATTMATSPSDGDDWSDGGARLERRRRQRREVSRG
uniref:Retrotransposon protein, putative, unclassified n=2 Tax=Oryza sativa subsp. japonica TaxID=39947 RepID=Q7Y0A5_ORYSJ|nr:hypothetical protein [Oryza sativa Japonica Group]ABF97987.1 retrotransposon protein, putative, unclassified [Oryza sativa Japonica Group]